MIVLLSIISFVLDGIISSYIPSNSLFIPLFTIVSLVLIFPYFNNNYYRYFKYIALIGLLYDIVYLNSFFYNFFIFIILGFLISFLTYLLSNNWYINSFITIITIIFYRTITYLYLVLFKTLEFSFSALLEGIYSSLLLNIIYFIVAYIISEIYSNKHKIIRSK